MRISGPGQSRFRGGSHVEGIDTLEKRANEPISSAAIQSNLELCGVPGGTGTARGHILSNQLGPHGRPIAFVYAGDPAEPDGDSIFLQPDRMRQSVNFLQLTRGHAYPLFYDTLFADLRDAMSQEAQAARAADRGLWPQDATTAGAEWAGAASLATMPPIFPKLWRHLDTYSRDPDINDPTSLAEFPEYLEFTRPERVFVLPEARTTGIDDVVQVQGTKVGLLFAPEELVVISA